MQIKSLFLPIISLFILTTCTITDDLFIEKQEPKINIQAKAEENIGILITSQLDSNETYKPYGFTALKIVKPIAIDELEQLERQLKTHPEDSTLQKKIEAKKNLIRDEKIERSANLDHIFTVTSDTLSISILELNYELNDTLAVTNWTPKIAANVPYSYKLIIEYYFNEHTIFKAPTYAEGRSLSQSFYRYFKDHLETLTNIEDKSAFLVHTLNICLKLKEIGEFDQNKITQALFERYLAENRPELKEYTPLVYSDLYETKNNKDSSLVGYYFFHKFSGNYSNQIDTNLVLVEFSPYYEVGNIFQLEGTIDSYIKSN